MTSINPGRSRSSGRSRSIGVRSLSCLAAICCLTGCAPKVLENRSVELVKPPAALLTCSPAPQVPSVDVLAAPQGDNAFAAYVGRLESAHRDCWCAVQEIQAWVNTDLPPAICLE